MPLINKQESPKIVIYFFCNWINMNQQAINVDFELESEFGLEEYEYQSNFDRICSRMALAGMLWQGIFVIMAILSLLMVVVMNAIANMVGVLAFILIAVLLFYGAFLPYRHAKTEISLYYELLDDGEELWALSDYPLSGFFHYLSIMQWFIFIIMLILSWISVVFLVIAFDNNHQGTLLLFLLLFVFSFVIIMAIIYYANAKKDYDLSE